MEKSTLNLQVDLEFKSLLPAMSDVDYALLKDSIKEKGLLQAIIVNEKGFILDGHHRYRACMELGIEPQHRIMKLASRQKEIEFILQTNIIRRHLTTSQRVRLVMDIEPRYAEEGKRRRIAKLKHVSSSVQNNANDDKGRTDAKCAMLAGMSASQYRKWKYVINHAPELIEEIDSGLRSINEVFRTLRAEKELAIEEPEDRADFPNVKLFNGDYRHLKDISTESIDLIVAIPSPDQQSQSQYSDLMEFAARTLKNRGRLLVYVPQDKMDIVVLGKKAGLTYRWLIAATSQSLNSQTGSHSIVPILLFSKCDISVKYLFPQDLFWIKSQFDKMTISQFLIENFSREPEVVCDPMMNSIDIGIAAVRQKREFVGIAMERQVFELARNYISSEMKESGSAEAT